MTEKRFKSENIKFSNFIVDLNSAISKGANITKYKSYDTNTKKKCDELTDLLNRLNDENEQLKQSINNLMDSQEWWEKKAKQRVQELENENEQLKKTIKNVCDLLAEEVDIFSDKATEHDICAYVELKELDNKDAYYMATSTKKAIKMLKECFDD